MNMKTEPDGRAFPTPISTSTHYHGLTKREYFAAMAMPAFINASIDLAKVGVETTIGKTMTDSVLAADALIAALNEGQE